MEHNCIFCNLCGRINLQNTICYPMLHQNQIIDRSFQHAMTTSQTTPGDFAPTYAYFPQAVAPQITVPGPADPQTMVVTSPSHQPSHLLPSYRSSLENRDRIVATVAPAPLQGALAEALQSRWWLDNQLEPDDELSLFILPESRTRFRCQANGCNSIFSRRDRAINHFRSHIDHRPYACNGQCEGIGCTLAFLSQRDLQSHISRPVLTCSRCDRVVTKRNLGRHRQSRKCIRTSKARSSVLPNQPSGTTGEYAEPVW